LAASIGQAPTARFSFLMSLQAANEAQTARIPTPLALRVTSPRARGVFARSAWFRHHHARFGGDLTHSRPFATGCSLRNAVEVRESTSIDHANRGLYLVGKFQPSRWAQTTAAWLFSRSPSRCAAKIF